MFNTLSSNSDVLNTHNRFTSGFIFECKLNTIVTVFKCFSCNGIFIDCTHMAKRDVPLELERKLFILAGSLVLRAHEHVVEEEEVPQLPLTLGQLDDERVFDEMSLRSFEMGKQGLGVLHVVFVHKVLRGLKRFVQGTKILTLLRRVF